MKESQGGKLNARDSKHLEDLERDLVRVKKAREDLGDKAPQFGGAARRGGEEVKGGKGRGGYGGLGKRSRDEGDEEEESEETDEEVRRIPWPRDTPPPIPGQFRRQQQQQQQQQQRHGTNTNPGTLGVDPKLPERPDTSLPSKPAVMAAPTPKTTYESKPQVRDLRQEATKAFLPSVVKKKIDAVKGRGPGGKLLEEEEIEALEKEGYGIMTEKAREGDGAEGIGRSVTNESIREGEGGTKSEVDGSQNARQDRALVGVREEEGRTLREEMERFEQEMVEAEPLGDEGEIGDGGYEKWESKEGNDEVNASERIQEMDDLHARVEEASDENI